MGSSSRSARKEKRKQTNRILNTAIAVVVLLIVIVGFTIFAGANEKPAAPEKAASSNQAASEEKETAAQETGETAEKQAASAPVEKAETAKPKTEEPKTEEPKTKEPVQEPIVKEGTEPNVEQEIVDPNWKSVETAQSGNHESSFETESVDWQEKEQALAYATGIPRENLTVWYISGNGPSGAIGTVSPKSNQDEAYRVYIEWVDGAGWKPVKVQKLAENDKGR